MAGHTGIIEVTIKSLEAMDTGIGVIRQAVEKMSGILLITADHGNAEEMLDSNGNPKTSHSRNPVPFIVYDPNYDPKNYGLNKQISEPQLANIASTILFFLGYQKPDFYLDSLCKVT